MRKYRRIWRGAVGDRDHIVGLDTKGYKQCSAASTLYLKIYQYHLKIIYTISTSLKLKASQIVTTTSLKLILLCLHQFRFSLLLLTQYQLLNYFKTANSLVSTRFKTTTSFVITSLKRHGLAVSEQYDEKKEICVNILSCFLVCCLPNSLTKHRKIRHNAQCYVYTKRYQCIHNTF